MFYSVRHRQSRGSATAMAEESFPNLTGVFSVVPTPFDAEGNVDLPSLRRVVDLYIGAGVDGLTALGVTSEAASLDDRERALILGTVLSHAAGRVPVVAGTMADGLQVCIERSRAAIPAPPRPRSRSRGNHGRGPPGLHRAQPSRHRRRRGGGDGQPAASGQ